MDNYNYPVGADTKDAPWNQEDKTIEVLVSITLSKPIKIKVSDYEEVKDYDDEGRPYIDFDYSNCDLKAAVERQVYLPHELDVAQANFTSIHIPKVIMNDFLDWNVDDFEVIME